MILDAAFEKTLIIPKDLRKLLLPEKPITHRYVFNEDASHKMGRFLTTCPDIICREASMTSTPFPNTYIEIDCLAAIKGTGDQVDRDTAPRLGFWFVNEMCFTVYGEEKYAEFSPFMFIPAHTTRPITDYFTDVKSIRGYRLLKELLMLGYVGKEFDRAKLSSMLTSNFELKYVSDILTKIKDAPREKQEEIFSAFVQNDVGTLKKAFACLLLLDARSQRKTINVAAAMKIVKGKLRAYAAHDVITLTLTCRRSAPSTTAMPDTTPHPSSTRLPDTGCITIAQASVSTAGHPCIRSMPKRLT